MRKFPASCTTLTKNHRLPIIDMKPPLNLQQAAVPAPTATGFIARIRRVCETVWRIKEREKSRIREGIAQIPGLMALLMKPRNGQKWTKAERDELHMHLRRLSRLSIYLTTAVLPGTTLTLPLIAWWLDRRQKKRPPLLSP